ncbi:hypothetical protein [Staphylococcus hyicus]|uniref:Uncharacterized protein n=1 Tax=Staphylococcus hyicus TaxID=1284 RepID=A0ACD5FJE0_STAHY|nr:hypothetical protein [Staphylococcus hyicus]MDP4464240.1 hypothetical protein [Staphylococcus hyicus]
MKINTKNMFLIYMWAIGFISLSNKQNIFISLYLFATILILLIINMKNKKLNDYLINIYHIRKSNLLLEIWEILDIKKKKHKDTVKIYFKKLMEVIYVFGFIVIISLSVVYKMFSGLHPATYYLLIAFFIVFLFNTFSLILYYFPIFIIAIVPFISFFTVIYLFDSKVIGSIMILKILFIIISTVIFSLVCLISQPYIIRVLHKYQLLINGVPNTILLVIIFWFKSLQKPPLIIKENESFSKLPKEFKEILSNQEFLNLVRDIIYQYQMTEITSEINTYILTITIMIFNFSVILNLKSRFDNKKAVKLLSNIRHEIMIEKKINYFDLQKISYYGGEYYEDQLISLSGVYEYIYGIEVEGNLP